MQHCTENLLVLRDTSVWKYIELLLHNKVCNTARFLNDVFHSYACVEKHSKLFYKGEHNFRPLRCIQYVTIFPACLGPEGCRVRGLSGIYVARPKMGGGGEQENK
jgi:hypothetical protein